MANSFTMFKKIGEAAGMLPKEDRDALFAALCGYGYYGEEPGDGDLPYLAAVLYIALKEDIANSITARSNGGKGGRPRKAEPVKTESEPTVLDNGEPTVSNYAEPQVPSKSKPEVPSQAEPEVIERIDPGVSLDKKPEVSQIQKPGVSEKEKTGGFGKNENPNQTKPNQEISSPLSHSLGRLKASDEEFDSFCGLFDRKPGQRRRETREKFDKLLEKGYAGEVICRGAERYLAETAPDARIRFPLVFLQDADLLRAWCGTPPKQVAPESLKATPDGWAYPFAGGFALVDCGKDATADEALAAVRTMVEEAGYEL